MKVLYTLFFCILSLATYAQNFYDVETVQTIEVNFAESNWDQLMDAAYANDAGYILARSITINGVEFDSVGVKYKGNSTYNSNQAKNPWHIELDTYKDHEYNGYTDIKLANGSKDPSMIRDVLAYDVLRQYMAAPQANFANLYVNGDLIGLYANTESISKKFMMSKFGSKDNVRFKCSPPDGAGPQSNDLPDLVYLGQDSTDYYAGYECKTDDGWQDLIDLCDTLSNQTEFIEEILDVDRTLWMLAFNNVIVNLDSYIGNFQQNYYLYRSDEGQFLPVVWDLNESFGVFSQTGTINLNGTAGKQTMTPLLHANDNNFPLVQKLLSDPTYRKMYIAHMKTILLENFDNDVYVEKGEMLQEIIDESVQIDDNKFYTYANFISNLNSDIGGGGGGGPGGGGPGGGNSTPGITNLMNARSDYLLGLSDFADTEPSITNIVVSNLNPEISENINITANVVDATNVVLGYRSDDLTAPFIKVNMFDDGAHGDGAANDGIYGADLTINDLTTDYYIYAENDDSGMFSPRRAQYEFYEIRAIVNSSINGVVINEIMASNGNTATDPDGEFDDWIELYNNTSDVVDLSGAYLSDNSEELTLWSFPVGTSIAAGGFLIIWADEDLDQDGLHADFKLSAAGESLILTNTDGVTVVDEVDYPEQTTDVSFARIPNGTGSFQATMPTFNTNNDDGVDCSALGGDADNDGICADLDCDDTNASIGEMQAAGTTCDDGDDTNVLDVIQDDGCTCSGTIIIPGDVVINELMASNEFTVVDPNGEAEDWIELYNNSSQNINLNGYFLSDDASNLLKWGFPDGTTIAAGAYLTVWADEDADQDGLHADFKLSNGGESIILSNNNAPSSPLIMDAVEYPEQTTDISYGRFPNGTGSFQLMDPTFGAMNSNTVNTIDISASKQVKVYPNPTTDDFFLEFNNDISKQRAVTIFHISGQKVYHNILGSRTLISTSDWAPGMYIIRSEGVTKKLIRN